MDELIKTLEIEHDKWIGSRDKGELDGALFYIAADALESAQKRIEELEAKQRWIPVEDRLPSEDEYRNGNRFKSMDSNELVPFLVCCKDTEIPFRAFYDGKSWGDGWAKLCVTHWKPLPEPPEGA